jgi:hypothetical protein
MLKGTLTTGLAAVALASVAGTAATAAPLSAPATAVEHTSAAQPAGWGRRGYYGAYPVFGWGYAAPYYAYGWGPSYYGYGWGAPYYSYPSSYYSYAPYYRSDQGWGRPYYWRRYDRWGRY